MSAGTEALISTARDRFEFWAEFIRERGLARVAEIGVRRGVFAERMLRQCPSIQRYYMVDPWQHLAGWNKRGNVSADQHEAFFHEAMERTAFADSRRRVLRTTTPQAAALLDDIDFVYIDGDHTLRGITLDLVTLFGKVRAGGWIGGDDFTPSIWQHDRRYEPSLVFPFAVHFAEAMDCPIYGLPFDQFLMAKGGGFAFHDLTGRYGELGLRGQMLNGQV